MVLYELGRKVHIGHALRRDENISNLDAARKRRRAPDEKLDDLAYLFLNRVIELYLLVLGR